MNQRPAQVLKTAVSIINLEAIQLDMSKALMWLTKCENGLAPNASQISWACYICLCDVAPFFRSLAAVHLNSALTADFFSGQEKRKIE